MRIGITYTVIRPEEKMLRERAAERGEVYLLHESELVFPRSYDVDVVIIRNMGYYKSLYLAKLFESMGIPTVNPWRVIVEAGDKLLSTVKLRGCVKIPEWRAAFNEEASERAADEIGYPLVLKPIAGSWGRMLSKIDDDDALNAVLEHRKWMGNPLHRIYYMQRFVRKPGRDIRSYVIKGEYITAIYRYSEHWITNTARGGRAEPCGDERVRELSLRAWECFGEGALAIDIFEEDGELFVNEMNPGMEFKNVVRVTGVDIPGKIVDYAVEVARR